MESEEKDSECSDKLYPQELEMLKGMFEDHFSSEVIAGVLEDCYGDVNLAVDTLTKIEDAPTSTVAENTSPQTTYVENNIMEVSEYNGDNMVATHNLNPDAPSFASVSRTTTSTAMSNPTRLPPRKNIMPKVNYWTDQLRNICASYNDGNRILIIMRGAPGCGKSYLAKVIVENTVGTTNPKNFLHHIFSSDDLMAVNGRYHFDVNRLHEVHTKNQTNACKALCEGRSPVVVDNTHIRIWEMYPYVRVGIKYGYIIELIQPSNPWSDDPSQLAKRTVHGVSEGKILHMLKNLQHPGLTGESLMKIFNIEYSVHMKPPVKRNKPPYEPLLPPVLHKEKNKKNPEIKPIEGISQNVNNSLGTIIAENLLNFQSNSETTKKIAEGEACNLDQLQQKPSIADKSLHELLKVETEGDNGDGWEISQSHTSGLLNSKRNVIEKLSVDPKQQRSKINDASNQFIEPSMIKANWIDNLPSHSTSNCNKASSKKGLENQEQTEIISNNNSNDDKGNTIFAVPEIIVELPSPNHDLTQTSSNEDINAWAVKDRCVHEEKHFKQFRKMFKQVSRAVLREIFDNCTGDVDWACSIVLEYFESMQQNNLVEVGDEQSDSEDDEEVYSQCECDKPRDIKISHTLTKTLPASDNTLPNDILIKKKSKKDKILTDDTIQIKKQIENTVKISEHHYSQHYLNMRRRYEDKSPNDMTSTSNNPGTSAPPTSVLDAVPSTSATVMKSQHDLNMRMRFEDKNPNDVASNSNNPGTSAPSTSVLDAVPSTSATVMKSQHDLNMRMRFEDKNPNDMTSTSNNPGTSAPPTSVSDAVPSTSATMMESQHDLNMRMRFEDKNPNDMASMSNNPEISAPPTSVSDAVPSTSAAVMESQHDLNMQMRFEDKNPNDMASTSNNPGTSASPTSVLDTMPSTSDTVKEEYSLTDEEYDDDYGDMSGSDEGMVENVHVNIGMEFIRQLDILYNRRDFEYPAGIKSEMSIPIRILDEINAFWIEAVSNQMDKLKTQSEQMIKEDEEFARKLELELQLETGSLEEENEGAAANPKKLTMKELMAEECALSYYEKQVKEEWKSKEPQDIAAQMTRKKLYELFPDVGHETLSEMLIAHGNSFNNTVEVLLISTGQGHFLDETNGINKFVMEQENKAKIMQAEQNAALDEQEYPYLLKPGPEGQTEVTLDSVNELRVKAHKFLLSRNDLYRKADWYFSRKRLSEATYYSQLAALHTTKFEKASNFAAAALIQLHSKANPNSNVIDLHFLRVVEAETSLDLYIDGRIRKLRSGGHQKTIVIHIITGRGKHSPGGPRLKPAIKKRLRYRGLRYREQNPGLIEAQLKPSHFLLDEILNN